MNGPASGLVATGICRRFGGVRALEAVSLAVRPGQVHGLLGANGAGKSTLIGVLSGAVLPDAGQLTVDGRPVPFGSVAAARRAGLAVVHQELMLFPDRSVEENVAAVALPTRLGLIDRAARKRKVEGVLAALGSHLDLGVAAGTLPLAKRQMVEIGRALCGGGSVFVLDEPTSALSQPEAAALFSAIRAIVAEGAAVVFVSHRFEEVFAITDIITVLRDGRVAGTWKTDQVEVPTLTRAMVGDLEAQPARKRHAPVAAPVLTLRNAVAPGLAIPDFALWGGEILGLVGLEGSGPRTLLEVLGGVTRTNGDMHLEGAPVRFRNPADAIRAGISFMPPDRKRGGLWLDRPALWNLATVWMERAAPLAFGSRAALDRSSAALLDDVGVRLASRADPVARLSGGNQQRVLLARSLASGPRVLLLSDFTRGVDVGAKAAIHKLVRAFADRGVAICLTSSDLGEVLEMADRILCFRGGRVVASGPSGDFDQAGALALISTTAAAA